MINFNEPLYTTVLLGPVGNKALPGPGDESVDFVIGYKEEEFNVLLKRLRDLSRKNPQKVTKLFGDFLEELGTILNEDKNEERLEGNRSPVVTNQDKEQMMRSENTLTWSGTVKTLRKRGVEVGRKIVKRKSFGKGRKDDKTRKRKGGKSKDKKINKSRKLSKKKAGKGYQQKKTKIQLILEMAEIKQRAKLIQERNDELDVCTNLWVELTNLGLGVATALQKQVMDADLVTKLTSLPGKFHKK